MQVREGLLVLYVLLMGVGSAACLILDFSTDATTTAAIPFSCLTSDQRLILLAFLAGTTGSFIHAAQSLGSYLGNLAFKPSWTAWYFLRPWIGGILGLAIYVTFRAGLVSGANSEVNPYGIVALGLLGGWFSKTTSDKLQEVFETLFKTDADRKRKDKLQDTRPVVDHFQPSPIPAGRNDFEVHGKNFTNGTVIILGNQEAPTTWVSDSLLKVSLAGITRPHGNVTVKVKPGQDAVDTGKQLTILPAPSLAISSSSTSSSSGASTSSSSGASTSSSSGTSPTSSSSNSA